MNGPGTELRVSITKRPDGGAVLRCVRRDGSEAWQKHEGAGARFFPFHDLTHLAVESELGFGSTFHVEIPFGVRALETPRAVPRDLADLKGTTVLVVDDNATNRRILDEILVNWGMKPTLVDGGRSALHALERAKAAGIPFGLVLLDFQMPEMDGFEVAERIKGHPELAATTYTMRLRKRG